VGEVKTMGEKIEEKVVLEAKNISRTYDKGEVAVPALKNCSLTLEKGEFVAVIGKSGSGKSTLLRILATLDTPDEGELYIRGERVNGWKDSQLAAFRRKNIGFIYQDYNLFPEYTAYENIIMPIHLDGRTEDKDEIMNLMERLNIIHCRNKFPKEMSGGEQQRTSIARALATKPAVVLADEPTGNLDTENAAQVANMLRLAAETYNQTIVMVTHDNQMAEYAHRIIRIVDGVVEV
jgi:putative ABC transport system ATP-binding protein